MDITALEIGRVTKIGRVYLAICKLCSIRNADVTTLTICYALCALNGFALLKFSQWTNPGISMYS